MTTQLYCKINWQFLCLRRGHFPRHRDPHGPRGGSRGSTLRQGGHVEQLLHATAHAQWVPPMDTLLLAATVSAGESLLCCHWEAWHFHSQASSHFCRRLCVRSSKSLRPSGRFHPTATTSRPKYSKPGSGRTLRDERQQKSSGGKPLKPSEQVNGGLRM